MKSFDIQAKYKVSVTGLKKLEQFAQLNDKLGAGVAASGAGLFKFGAATRSASSGMGKLSSAADSSSNRFAALGASARDSAKTALGAWGGLGSAIGKLGLGAGVVAGAGGLLLGAGANVAADFEAQMSDASAVLGATKAELGSLTKIALEMGKKTSFSASQAASGIEALGSAGMSTKDIIGGGLNGALALAAATGVKDLGFAGTTAATAMNVFGLKGKDVAKVADVVASAANISAMRVEDFAQAISSGGSAASQFKLSLTDFTGALTLLADKGIKGAEAGTNIKSALTNAATAAPKVRKAMDAVGFSMYKAGGTARKSLVEIVQNLEKVTKKMDVAERDKFLADTFGSYGISTFNTLLGAGSAKLIERKKQLEVLGSAERAAKTRLDNLRGSQEQFKGSLETLGIVVGSKFTPALRRMTDAGTAALNRLLDYYGDPAVSAKLSSFADGMADGIISETNKFVTFLTNKTPEVLAFATGFKDSMLGAFETVGQGIDKIKAGLEFIGFKDAPPKPGTDNARSGRGQAELQAGQSGKVAGTVAAVAASAGAVLLANKLTGGLVPKILGGLGKAILNRGKGIPKGVPGLPGALGSLGAAGMPVFVTNLGEIGGTGGLPGTGDLPGRGTPRVPTGNTGGARGAWWQQIGKTIAQGAKTALGGAGRLAGGAGGLAARGAAGAVGLLATGGTAVGAAGLAAAGGAVAAGGGIGVGIGMGLNALGAQEFLSKVGVTDFFARLVFGMGKYEDEIKKSAGDLAKLRGSMVAPSASSSKNFIGPPAPAPVLQPIPNLLPLPIPAPQIVTLNVPVSAQGLDAGTVQALQATIRASAMRDLNAAIAKANSNARAALDGATASLKAQTLAVTPVPR